MADYTIEQIVGQEEWKGRDGQMMAYEVMLSGHNQSVKLHKPVGVPGYQVGENVSGVIDGAKFKRATGPQRSPNGSSQDELGRFDRKPEHPDNVARMKHTSALSAAPTYIEQMLTIGVIPQPQSKDDYVKTAEGVMTWLEGTYPS